MFRGVVETPRGAVVGGDAAAGGAGVSDSQEHHRANPVRTRTVARREEGHPKVTRADGCRL